MHSDEKALLWSLGMVLGSLLSIFILVAVATAVTDIEKDDCVETAETYICPK